MAAGAKWSEFAESEPDMVRLCGMLFGKCGMAYLATVTHGEQPAIHPVSPAVVGGELVLTIVPATPKLADLRATGRYALHCLPGPGNMEVQLRGPCEEVTDDTRRQGLLDSVGEGPVVIAEDDIVFVLRIAHAHVVQHENVGQPDMRRTIIRWTPHRGRETIVR